MPRSPRGLEIVHIEVLTYCVFVFVFSGAVFNAALNTNTDISAQGRIGGNNVRLECSARYAVPETHDLVDCQWQDGESP